MMMIKYVALRRCIGINGINLAATKPDLLDRGLQFLLQRIDKKYRLKKKQLIENSKNYVLMF